MSWLDKCSRDLQKGDALLSSDAVIDIVVPSHHNEKVYLEWVWANGDRRSATVDADFVVAVWIPDRMASP